ncbi:MAG: minor capsid protein, partial [Methanomicrobium sp.]|nr:minor capsid protein [Methanomicrobium sp.]
MPDLSARITEATNIAKTRADTIARTETINACIDGARQRYQQLGIEEVEVIACDDSRTCPICTTHDGKIYKLSDDANLPPYHPNCRCAIKAVVKKRDK